MNLKGAVSVVTIGSFMFASTPAFAADQDRQVSPKAASTHSVTTADLHRTAQISREEANAVRESLNAFLATPEVISQMSQLGIGHEKVASHVARLSDEELARVQQQLMAAGLQTTPAGLNRGAIVAIVLGGVTLMVVAIVILVNADPYHTTYYY